MPIRIGLLTYPVLLAAAALGRPDAVSAFEAADAYSPESSRRPDGLGVPRKALHRAVRKGLVIPVGDGRYYLDRVAMKRADRKKLTMLVVTGVSMLPLLWVVL